MNKNTVGILCAILVMLSAPGVLAQQDTSVRKPVRAEVKQVQPKRLSVKPAGADIPVIVATNKARFMPSAVAKSDDAKPSPSTTLAAAPKGELKNVKLTVRNNYTPLANLSFRAAGINSKENYASWSKNTYAITYGAVTAGLYVKAGERYLLDYEITARRNMTTFGINVGDTRQDMTVSTGRQNLLAYLDATETAEIIALLNSNYANFIFHSLTVTRVD